MCSATDMSTLLLKADNIACLNSHFVGSFDNRIRHKPATTLSRNDWPFAANRAVVGVDPGSRLRSEILPRRLHCRGGASVVGGMPPQTERRISNV